jgi:hypothetical protein
MITSGNIVELITTVRKRSLILQESIVCSSYQLALTFFVVSGPEKQHNWNALCLLSVEQFGVTEYRVCYAILHDMFRSR